MGEAAGEVTGSADRPDGESADATATGDPEVEQLVEEIAETRGEMTTTVEEIGERLDPKNIVAGAKETVREATVGKVEQMANTAGDMVSNAGQTAQEAGSGIVDTIRRNPVPAALAGIGIGWLAMSARGQGSKRDWSRGEYRGYDARYGYGQQGYGQQGYDQGYGSAGSSWDTQSMGRQDSGEGIVDKVGQTAGDVVGNVQHTAGEVVGTVGMRAGQVVDQVGSTAGQVPQQVGGVVRQVGDNAGRFYHDSPLAVGAIAVAVGAAVGMLLPATRTERQVLGQARDQVIDRAETVASEALSEAEQKARDAEQQARAH